MQIHNRNTSMAKLECDAALSDLILQAARGAVPADVNKLITLPAAGLKNDPLMPLLIGLIDSTQAVAAAIADNAWDDCRPLDKDLARDLARQARQIAADIENATECPDARTWTAPQVQTAA